MLAVSAVLGVLALALAWPVPVALSRRTGRPRARGGARPLAGDRAGGRLSMIGCLLAFGSAPRARPGHRDRARTAPLSGPHPDRLRRRPDRGAHPRGRRDAAALASTSRSPRCGPSATPPPAPAHRPAQRPDAGRAAHARARAPGAARLLRARHPHRDRAHRRAHRGARADELAAVIAHERTHLEQLHHLVRLAFRAWHSACRGSPSPTGPNARSSSSPRCSPTTAPAARLGTDALRRALERVGDAGEPGRIRCHGGRESRRGDARRPPRPAPRPPTVAGRRPRAVRAPRRSRHPSPSSPCPSGMAAILGIVP